MRLGYFGRFDALSVGASWSPKMKMGKLDEYKGLFAGGGGFDIPENYSVGVAFNPAPTWTVAADYQRINYAGVPSVGNPSLPVAPLGAANGPGFGWHDIDIFKLGVAWQMNSQLVLRAGYNHGDNPIKPADVTFNILAPGVITEPLHLRLHPRAVGQRRTDRRADDRAAPERHRRLAVQRR